MHGPEECEFTDLIFEKVEKVLGLKKFNFVWNNGRRKKNFCEFKRMY